MENIEHLKYPIGKFEKPEVISNEMIAEGIALIATFPQKLRRETQTLTDVQLDTPYRPGGWTVRQVIHHCADSHMNCYIRIKWTLTEDNPLIKPYDEALWSQEADNRTMPIAPTLQLLDGLHFRLSFLLEKLTDNELNRQYIHPEYGETYTLSQVVCLYAWHCNHHLAHITQLKLANSWM